MKKSLFLSVAAILAFIVGCDNAANMEAMKAQTSRTIDSLATAEVAVQRAALLNQCNQNIDNAIRLRVDSLMAIATPAKNLAGSTKKPTPKPATKPKPTPTPTPPPPAKPKTPVEEQKDRGGAATTGEQGVKDQKARGAATTVNEDKTAKPEEIKKQKGRGAATTVPVPPK